MMSEHDFDSRLKRIEQQYAGKREGADAWRDQEVALLFVECGWSQVMIARHMGWSDGKVSRQLLFGRFLRILPSGQDSFSPPKPLTERRFRDNYSKAGNRKKETEGERFARVLGLLRADTTEAPKGYGNLVKKPGIKAAVAEILADGSRHTTPEIAERISGSIPGTDAKQVIEAIKQLRRKPPAGMALEERHNGRSHRYRLVKRRGPPPAPVSSLDEAGAVIAESLPLIEECIDIMRSPVVGREQSLALDHLDRVQKALKRLLVAEAVV